MGLTRRLGPWMAGLTLMACATDAHDEASPTQATDLWARYTQLSCGKVRLCCEREKLSTPALETCEEDLPAQQGIDHILRFIGNGSLAMDGESFGRCLDEIERAQDSCLLDDSTLSCAPILKGKLGEGEPCESALQCEPSQGGAVCQFIEADSGSGEESSLGQCRGNLRGKLGDPCLHTCEAESCYLTSHGGASEPSAMLCFTDDGLYCDFVSRTCQTLVGIGETCDFDEACGPDAHCSDDKHCQELLAVGEVCGEGDACAVGLVCAQSMCSPRSAVDQSLCKGDYD